MDENSTVLELKELYKNDNRRSESETEEEYVQRHLRNIFGNGGWNRHTAEKLIKELKTHGL